MLKNLFVRNSLTSAVVALPLAFPLCAPAVTIHSTPTFAPSSNAPLAGVLTLNTDVPSRVSVQVSDGTNTWEKDFYDFGTTHAEPMFGFKPGRTNQMLITVYDAFRGSFTAAQPVVFVSPSLPAGFPSSTVLVSNPGQMEPGYTLFIINWQSTGQDFLTIVDNTGQVVWCLANPPSYTDVRQLANGDLFMPALNQQNFVEMNLLGQTVKTWNAAPGYPINVHDGVPTGHGTILYLTDLSRVETNFPTSSTNPNAPLRTTAVDYNAVVEISATNSELLNTWSLIDMLDPYRLTYLTFDFTTGLGLDIEHANAVIEDPRDNSIIVSLREQSAIIKFSRATGKLVWILGPPENWSAAFEPYLFTPVGPITWNFGQHAPTITPQGTLLFYDDGNDRAMPFDPPVPDQQNYSSAVEYSLDETNRKVAQVWTSGATNNDCLFTTVVGNAEFLPQTGNVLTTFGWVTFLNGAPPSAQNPIATMVRIKEFTHDPVPQVVFDLSFDPLNLGDFAGYSCYRSRRIPDLYGHLPAPVANLAVLYESGAPHLEFSADPTFTYAVEASADLVNWQQIGIAESGDLAGDFDFYDLSSNQSTARFYRVVTQQP